MRWLDGITDSMDMSLGTCRHRATRMNMAAGNHGNQERWVEGGVLSLRKTRARLNGFHMCLRTIKHLEAGNHMS